MGKKDDIKEILKVLKEKLEIVEDSVESEDLIEEIAELEKQLNHPILKKFMKVLGIIGSVAAVVSMVIGIIVSLI